MTDKPSCVLTSVAFQSYTDAEIENLSVLEVTTPKTLIALGHPVPGGVYDRALGTGHTKSRDVCATCAGDGERCNGHIGHIRLSLPVFNPLFAKTLHTLLKGCCLSCHRLLASKSQCLLLIAQLTTLNYGLINTAQQLIDEVGMLLNSNEDGAMVEVDNILQSRINETIKDCDQASSKELNVKNIVECRQRFLREFFRQFFVPKSKKCHHCKATKYPLYLLQNNTLVTSSIKSEKLSVRKVDKKKKKKDNMDEESILLESEITEVGETEKLKKGQSILTPLEVQKHLKAIWENESSTLVYLFPALKSLSPVDIFIRYVIPVPPPKFRPLNKVGDQNFENPQSLNLSKVIQTSIVIRHIIKQLKTGEEETSIIDDISRLLIKLNGNTNTEKLKSAWVQLQTQVNAVFDSDMTSKSSQDKTTIGVKQVIEKKEGLFRQNMMGKRVNYAARSVISPDPNISIEEIGIPEIIAKKLMYPQKVTPWNVDVLRQAVINGPDVYPGATMVESADGTRLRLAKSELKRTAVAMQLLTPSTDKSIEGCKLVYRHLINGDMLLVNRQPTLHKPSIMAHRARILPGEKTLRLHYSNCKTYNADFDGDEMNVHLPQNEISQSEAIEIANVTNQYLVPKDGTPLGGLIQDHMIAGVLMTIRGRFFQRDEYMQFLFKAIPSCLGKIQTLSPCIWKPEPLWSGKQIISTLLINLIPAGKPLITLEGVTKISTKSWQNFSPRPWTAGGQIKDSNMSESEFIIHDGELLCGVMDKAHYGPTPYSLVHCCYELYGGSISSAFLTALGRLFTAFMQSYGFSLGSFDIASERKADKKRTKIINKASKIGYDVAAQALLVKNSEDILEINEKLEAAHLDLDERFMKMLDVEMKMKTDEITNNISQVVMPDGLLKKFPENNLQLMVLCGAKGSSVNSMQISCSLGQIELEGRRPPLAQSGRTLPSFRPYDVSPRAGGFVAGRFATGIEPQEYYFHCMAGREGLVDTAVKTSRSGYLQRCLIKHLESLQVGYDMTVRDCDGSVIQFLYGEDGLDVGKSTFMNPKQLPFLAKNYGAIYREKAVKELKARSENDISSTKKSIKKWRRKHENTSTTRTSPFQCFSMKHGDTDKDDLIQMWDELSEDEKLKFIKKTSKCPDPISSLYNPSRDFGAIVENLEAIIEDYLNGTPINAIAKPSKVSSDIFRDTMYFKAMRSTCEPCEAVGLLAAQSVGEPSTQMTLNTFHFAGRGDMNVTLGIPRMREILMTASEKIATPSMEIPFLKSASDKVNEMILKLGRVSLDQVLGGIYISETLKIEPGLRYRVYNIQFKFLRYKNYQKLYYTTPDKVLHFMETVFFRKMMFALKKKCKLVNESKLIASHSLKDIGNEEEKNEEGDDNEEMDTSGDEIDDESAAARTKKQRGDGGTYEEKEDDDEGIEEDEEMYEDVGNDAMNEDSMLHANDDDEDNEMKEKKIESQEKLKAKEKEERVNYVLGLHSCVASYNYDSKKGEWCTIALRFKLEDSTVDMMSLLQAESKKAIIYEIPNINRAVTRKVKGETYIKTDGINIQEMFQFDQIFDINRLFCNNIHSVANAYGIEAARKVIVKEIQDVFGVYGIQVDPRHLLLIADYMTFDGTYAGLNRFAMQTSTSPLQQMSFETTMHFLQTATLQDCKDTLKSPSAQLIVGSAVRMGTGSFELIQKLC